MRKPDIFRTKRKEETPFWAYLLPLLVVNAVKTIGFVIICLLFYWASVQTFAKLEPMQALAMNYAILAAMIFWKGER